MFKKVLLPLVAAVFLASLILPATLLAAGGDSQPRPSVKDTASPGDSQAEPLPEGPAPEIFLPDTTHDFGIVAQSASLTNIFKVQNTGDAVLKIIKVKAS
jgi:hypothetical protein